MIRAVLFDVDGVLVDSRTANAEFYMRLLEQSGYDRPPRDEVDKYFHLPLWQGLERLTGSADQAVIKSIWDLGHDRTMYPTELLIFPKELDVVLAELQRQYRLGVVTSRIPSGVQSIYNEAHIGQFFDVAVAFGDYEHPKPHPEPLQVALKKLGLRPGEAIYIGDSHTDIDAAAAAGMYSIYLSSKEHPDATVAITNFDEIIAAVAQIAAA